MPIAKKRPAVPTGIAGLVYSSPPRGTLVAVTTTGALHGGWNRIEMSGLDRGPHRFKNPSCTLQFAFVEGRYGARGKSACSYRCYALAIGMNEDGKRWPFDSPTPYKEQLMTIAPKQILKSMTEQRENRVAIHESGHVVACFLLDDSMPRQFEYVTIVPNKDFFGHVLFKPSEFKIDPGNFSFDRCDELNTKLAGITQSELEARLIVSLAGEAATYIMEGRRDDILSGRDSWSGDFNDCMEFLERIFQCNEDPESPENQAANHYLEYLFWRTVLLLRQPASCEKVEAIAASLVDKKTLTFDECDRIVFS